jgi:hypothetical protein
MHMSSGLFEKSFEAYIHLTFVSVNVTTEIYSNHNIRKMMISQQRYSFHV